LDAALDEPKLVVQLDDRRTRPLDLIGATRGLMRFSAVARGGRLAALPRLRLGAAAHRSKLSARPRRRRGRHRSTYRVNGSSETPLR
jgi:hypothetical protein